MNRMRRKSTPPRTPLNRRAGALDTTLIADVVEREMHARFGTWAEMERAAIRLGSRRPPSRGTLYRVAMGAPDVTMGTYARIEAILHLPPGTLEAVGRHDLDELAAISVSKGLMVWIRHRLGLDPADAVVAPAPPAVEDAG